MHTLSVFIHNGDNASYCMYSMYSTMHAHWHQRINYTKHYFNKPVSVCIVKFCAVVRDITTGDVHYPVTCINILHDITQILSCGGLVVNKRVWITFSVVIRYFIFRQIQRQCNGLHVARQLIIFLMIQMFTVCLCVTLSRTFYRQHKLNLCESSVAVYLSTLSHQPPAATALLTFKRFLFK